MSGHTGVPLQVEDLVRTYGTERALDGLSLTVERGTVHALVGLNGAGKTTLMRTLVGMVEPDSGRVALWGTDVRHADADLWRRVGQMIEHPFVYPELSTREDLVCAARLHGLDRRTAQERSAELLARLRLDRWADRRTGALSLGNRQRLGIACAVVHEPALVILDEPTSALDPAGVLVVRELLAELAGRGCAVLVSSHHLDEVARVADRITVVHAGRAVGTLPPGGVDLERQFFAMVHDADLADAGTGEGVLR